MTNIAIYGGSFNPPHIAHILLVHYLLEMQIVDEVYVVPVFQHALDKQSAQFHERLSLCNLAFGSIPRVTVSEIESKLPTPSYTLRTLEALEKQRPEASWRLILGTDVLDEIHRWHRFEELTQKAPPLFISRQGYPSPADSSYEILPAVLPEISSSHLRSLLHSGRESEVIPYLPQRIRRNYLKK